MASYADWIVFRAAVLSADLLNRTQFSDIVKYSHVRDLGGLPDTLATRALLAAQALHLVPPHRACPTCEMPFKLCFKGGLYRWIGARYESQGCQECLDQQPQASTIGFLSNVKQHMWMPKLEAFMMWIFEYPRQQILRELHPADHKRVDAWTQSFQQTLSAWYQLQLNEGFDGPLFRRLHRASSRRPGTAATRKPASKTYKRPSTSSSKTALKRPSASSAALSKTALKRPSASSAALKRPSMNKTHIKFAGKARIFIADETHLNKRKRNALSRTGRPQRDQVRLWGAVLHGHIKTHFIFRILDHPNDACDGKPRGHKEMLKNIQTLGLRRGDIFVSDKWKATVSAFNSYKTVNNFSEADTRHEIVNHSEGEIVNSKGFSTNAIECKWSVIKRWIRRRMSGVLPAHSDRHKWRLLIDEYQARSLVTANGQHSFDNGNIITVRVRDVVRLFQVA